MSDSEEDYEYEYSDAESDAGTDDVSMDARSQEDEDAEDDDDASMTDTNNNTNSKKKAASDNNGNSGTNKRRSTGSFDARRRSGDNPNAAPMGGGKFDFDGKFSLTIETALCCGLSLLLYPIIALVLLFFTTSLSSYLSLSSPPFLFVPMTRRIRNSHAPRRRIKTNHGSPNSRSDRSPWCSTLCGDSSHERT